MDARMSWLIGREIGLSARREVLDPRTIGIPDNYPLAIRIDPHHLLSGPQPRLTPDEEAGLTMLAHDVYQYLHPD